jgi:tungstate transport system substrate-binding protein
MRFAGSILLVSTLVSSPIPAAAQFSTVRLAVVPSPEGTGLLRDLLPDFERETGYRVVVDASSEPYDVALAGRADLVISHYGHHAGLEAFVVQGLGMWPRAVFANQIAIIGPNGDPAHIRGLDDAGEAFRRIALGGSGAQFVSNNSAVMKYLESTLWEVAGHPRKDSWYVDTGASEAEGMAVAARVKGYYIFALPPFLEWQQSCPGNRPSFIGHIATPCGMEPLVLTGMPARTMVSIVVNPQRVPAVNFAGATALQEYLLRPAVQARIENFRDPTSKLQLWKAVGFNNTGASLGFGRRP